MTPEKLAEIRARNATLHARGEQWGPPHVCGPITQSVDDVRLLLELCDTLLDVQWLNDPSLTEEEEAAVTTAIQGKNAPWGDDP